MPIFPKIQSPCPYKSDLAAAMDGAMCRICKRNVFDLSAMNDGERLAFLAGCEEEVCVSYRVPLRPAIAAAALAAAALSVPAAAQEMAGSGVETAIEGAEFYPEEDYEIEVGGIKDPKAVELVEVETDQSLPALPVVYEDEPEAARSGAAPKISGPAAS